MDKEVRDTTGRILEGPAKHLRILERRRAYLDYRIEQARNQGKELMYDEFERDALVWAIDVLTERIEE